MLLGMFYFLYRLCDRIFTYDEVFISTHAYMSRENLRSIINIA